jgi:hypothetical protein
MSIELYGTVRCTNNGEVFVAPDGFSPGMPYEALREQEFRWISVVPIPGLRVKFRKAWDPAAQAPAVTLVAVQCECWKTVS